jgi:fumarate hydratase class II
VHGAINSTATGLFKIANDIRLLGSGPAPAWRTDPAGKRAGVIDHAGQGQPNAVRSNDHGVLPDFRKSTTITIAGSQGHFELNVYKPVMAHCMLQSIQLMSDTSRSLTEHCIVGILCRRKANR